MYKLLQTYFIDETENLQITLSLSRRERIGKWKGMGGGGEDTPFYKLHRYVYK